MATTVIYSKNPHAVALGKLGGAKTSEKKRIANRKNALKRWHKKK
jgi:hypothetical protein